MKSLEVNHSFLDKVRVQCGSLLLLLSRYRETLLGLGTNACCIVDRTVHKNDVITKQGLTDNVQLP